MTIELTWRDRIQQAMHYGGFTGRDKALAASFLSCAISEHHGEFSASGPGESIPADLDLFHLGMEFWHNVSEDDPHLAYQTYNSIQEWFMTHKES